MVSLRVGHLCIHLYMPKKEETMCIFGDLGLLKGNNVTFGHENCITLILPVENTVTGCACVEGIPLFVVLKENQEEKQETESILGVQLQKHTLCTPTENEACRFSVAWTTKSLK